MMQLVYSTIFNLFWKQNNFFIYIVNPQNPHYFYQNIKGFKGIQLYINRIAKKIDINI